MTGAVAESWARLRLVQGDSSAQVWELVASRGQTTLTVGSGPSSSWVIREEGVRPLHFSLHWDGATLRIADTYGAGDVRVDGVHVTAQWRSIVGRARIDFGKAAMVAETSAGAESEARPLEPSPLPPIVVNASQHKATLLGVSPLAADPPLELVTPKADSSAPKGDAPKAEAATAGAAASNGSDSAAPGSSDSSPPTDGTGSFRVARPSDSERARKATLMGIAISAPPPAPVPDIKVLDQPRSPEARGEQPNVEARGSARELGKDEPKKLPSQGIPTGTLIGVVGPLEARVQRLAAQDNGRLSDKRTMLGVPLKDLRIEPPHGQPNGETPSIVTQAEVRTVSATPVAAPASERIGSTWQEIPNSSRPISSRPPMAVLVDPPPAAAQTQRNVEHDAAPPGSGFDPRARGFDPRDRGFARERAAGFDPRASSYDRVSDIPTQMREVASLDSRRPKRTIPLRYIGIVVLTAAAYMAWLYLLDHL